jgi:hypothetical protein
MANPTALTLTLLIANAALAQPAADAIDTNGTLALAVPNGETDRVVLEVNNTDDAALTVTVKSGAASAGAVRGAIGDLAVSIPAGAVRIIGPFESARFQQAGGGLSVQFQAATGAPAASVRAYQLPKSA